MKIAAGQAPGGCADGTRHRFAVRLVLGAVCPEAGAYRKSPMRTGSEKERKGHVKKVHDAVRLCLAAVGAVFLFLLNFCYLFAALGLFSLGLAAFPASLLGAAGVIHVTSDLSLLPLLLVSMGAFLLGFGMCLGSLSVCPASARLVFRFFARRERERERLSDA